MKNLEANYIKLAAMDIPATGSSNISKEIRALIDDAFVHGFRLVMLICAGLAIASSIQAWLLIENKSRPPNQLTPT